MPAPAVPPAVLDALRKYDTPTVCNVIELFECRPRNTGYTDDRITACFTAGTMPSHGYTQIVDLDVPVRVGGVWVNPGDLLHGDRNGVTTIPLELAALTAEGCAGFVDAEAVVLEYLRKGNSTAAGFTA